ncbi:TetR/AcrR family transcriptional regulator [Nocardioides caldifontis]|uniref:TetR/AcrR family transcriptional regulator n=1 Tax=Nocardioides caldifontis TaxID=2588938 RepID=UPI0011DFF8D0|nr:TetR/AcrR family transcriptional regulator [Nocardioides caldifontis]
MTTRSDAIAAPPGGRRTGKSRDAERSRTAILDAAEQLFADLGFQGASLAAIAQRAHVSVGLPRYFFGSKEELHRAVLQRVFARRNAALDAVANAAEQLLENAPEDGEGALRLLVRGYLDFLLDNPSFVWLLTRDALEHAGRREQLPRHSEKFADRMVALMTRAGVAEATKAPEQLFLSLIGLCYFPLEHDATIVAGMGQRAWTPAFRDRRVEHIVRLLLHRDQ